LVVFVWLRGLPTNAELRSERAIQRKLDAIAGSLHEQIGAGVTPGPGDVRELFEELVEPLDYPMFIVTAAAGGERSGCLVGFATQTSIDPVRFAVCLSRANHTYRVACAADVLAVHLAEQSERSLAELFGGKTGDAIDKFARCDWRPGPDGVPILQRCPRWFVGRVLARVDAGDHDAFVLEPSVVASAAATGILNFQRARTIEPGHPA
jgi:flavin reductase (DIM6/NTAB) family NADH-FMN oxidoreductase RutF